jgi:hypothetical protein
MRTQSLSAYAAAHGLSLQKLLAFFRRGLVPEYVGRVTNPPVSVAAWSAKNGISRRTGLALYREEKCPRGVLLGQRSAAASTPWWMLQRYDSPVATELRRLARQRQKLRNELHLIRRSIQGQSKSFSAMRRIESRLKRLSARLESVEKEGSRLVVKVGRALAHVRRSEVLLSTRDLVELRALLGIVDRRTERKPLRCGPPGFPNGKHQDQTPRMTATATVQRSVKEKGDGRRVCGLCSRRS